MILSKVNKCDSRKNECNFIFVLRLLGCEV